MRQPIAPAPKDDLKVYLGYLDKEMTIMGILSSFCIVALGFVTEKLLTVPKDSKYQFWETTTPLCAIGLAGLLLAALSFYRQRSLLAWYYGQLSLFQAQGKTRDVHRLLVDSDSWYNWRWYQAGFAFLSIAFLELGAAVLSGTYHVKVDRQWVIGGSLLFVCAVCATFFICAYARFPYDEKPLSALWKRMFH